MKYIIIMFLFFSYNANASNYYIDNSGSDSNNGLSPGTAWKTIAKINSSTFAAGDSILLNRNGTWNEKLNVPSSGTAANPIVISYYGTGNKPLITGLQTQTGFTNVGNIWSATATNATLTLNTVLINGTLKAKGRFPNTGYNIFNSASGSPTNQITTATLTGTPNYTGGEVVVRPLHWILDKGTITSQAGAVLNFTALSHTNNGGNGYFIQNIASVLDTLGEWCIDGSKLLSIYATSSPTVQISTIDTLVYLRKKDHITFDGINFQGGNVYDIRSDTSNYLTIKNCLFNYTGKDAISGTFSKFLVIQLDSIQNSWSNAVSFGGFAANSSDSAIIDNNYIKNTGNVAGMGANSNSTCGGIWIVGLYPTITNNIIDSTGYIPVLWGGNAIIKYNYITNFCFVKDDGAGIYTSIGTALPANYDSGSIIRHNIMVNGIGALAGMAGSSIFSAGIYLDDTTRYVTIDSNTISIANTGALVLHNNKSITVRDNTVVDSIGTCLYYNGILSLLSVKRNILYSKSNAQFVSLFTATDLTESIDSNYYLRPVLESSQLKMASTTYSLPAWVTATGYDVNTSVTPTGVTAAIPLFFINPTLSNSIVQISGSYIDAKGVLYINSVTLSPFSSVILFKTITEYYAHTMSSVRFSKVVSQ